MLFVEAFAAALLGLLALWLVLRPLVHPTERSTPVFEPIDPEETPKGVALAALKEIEFDRETGKLSDADYESLKAKYTAEALAALRMEAAESAAVSAANMPEAVAGTTTGTVTGTGAPRSNRVACATCGPRPEPDAVFCSTCGRRLSRQVAA